MKNQPILCNTNMSGLLDAYLNYTMVDIVFLKTCFVHI